ncbi:glycosyltransferase [Rhizobium sullae]|nr:glycosyltransferase [Rhizobium sullae]
MTVDAVGGIWRYAMDLAGELRHGGVETVFAGFGPLPSAHQRREALSIGTLIWLEAPLDWTVDQEGRLVEIPKLLRRLVEEYPVDLLHLNLPSQAAGLAIGIPIVAVSHSCIATWFDSVRGCGLPHGWRWQNRRNRLGFDRADIVLAPSRSHADALRRCYGQITNLEVVHNCSRLVPLPAPKKDFVFAAGRWWDEGKNGVVLDQAAAFADWPVVMAGAAAGPSGQLFKAQHAEVAGELTHEETMVLMACAGIVASPSLYEPFGLAALEAARAGAALVLADIPTYRELWNGAAIFADPRAPRAFAAAINQLAADPVMRLDLGLLARRRSGEFLPDVQCHALLDVYARAMQHRHKLTAAE